MNPLITILISVLSLDIALGQTNTIYPNLQTKNFYAVHTSTVIQGKDTVYILNDRRVDKRTYSKYHTFDVLGSCCPCILKSYDEKNVLLSETVSCGDCGVGEFKVFYPNGKLKVHGAFKENPTNDWKDIFKRGYCNVPTGTWYFYNDFKGVHVLHHIEIWDNGEFMEQKPESKTTEIWGVDLWVNTTKIDTQAITLNDFKMLKVVPKYKNKLRNTSLKAKVSIASYGNAIRSVPEIECSLETLKDINIEAMIVASGIPTIEKVNITIYIYEKEQYIRGFFLKMKP